MRSYRFSYVIQSFVALTAMINTFFESIFRVDLGTAWRFVVHTVASFRKVGGFKPVYRDSYRTHGLSLVDGRMRT